MISKVKLFFRCIILNGFKNRLRTILSVIGLFVGVFFIAYTNILIDSFYNAKMKEVENMPQNVGLIYQYEDFTELDYNLLKNIVDIKPSFGICTIDTYAIKQKLLKNEIYLNIRANIVGVEDYDVSTVTVEDDKLHIVSNKLVDGKYITANDNLFANKVVVIDDILAKMLFPNKSPIGEKLNLSEMSGAVAMQSNNLNYEFEIIGVIESNYYKKYNEEIVANSINKERESEVTYITTIYMPESTMQELFNGEGMSYALWGYENQSKYYQDRNAIKTESELGLLSAGAGVFVDKEVEDNLIRTEIQEYKTIIITITIMMFIFSGLNNMNIFFFSIKERIREIGIRKTFGATKTDIVFQFMCEGLFVGLIASILAIIVSIILGIITINLAWVILEIKLVFRISLSSIMFPLLIGVFESIIFTIFPSLYGAKILITESIRFD